MNDLGEEPSSTIGAETDTARVGSVELLGGDEDGELLSTVGNGCLPLYGLWIEEGLEGEAALALLSLRPLYSAIRS